MANARTTGEAHSDLRQPALLAQIRSLLEHKLEASAGRLPSERQLTETFATTRITLREALLQLEAEGVIYREDRRGWFVSPPRLVYNPLRRGHFDRMVREQGRHPRTTLLESALALPPTKVAKALGLAAAEEAVHVRRLRYIDNRRVLYAEHFVRPSIGTEILRHDLTTSMTEIYAREYGITIGRIQFEIKPAALVGQAAGSLLVAGGSPSLQILRINYDQHDRVVDCDIEHWRHDALLVQVDASDTAQLEPRSVADRR